MSIFRMEKMMRDPLNDPNYDRSPGAVNYLIEPFPRPATGTVHPRYAELHAKMRAICEAKNSDYADSDTDPLRNFRAADRLGLTPLDGVLVRMTDKWERICNLTRKERESRTVAVKDESITDTLLDLANYALIAIVLHEEGRRPEPPRRDWERVFEDEALSDPEVLKVLVEDVIKEGVKKGEIEPGLLDAWNKSQGK